MEPIENVILRRTTPNCMLFEWGEEHKTLGNSLWLCGWNRPASVYAGDSGRLVYRTTESSGLWYFEKYKNLSNTGETE